MILLKAKKMPVGSKRKWKDGVYIKGADHKWHREKMHDVAMKQLKADKRHDDEELVEEFKTVLEEYINHLHDIDVSPHHATPDTDDEFWEEVFDSKDWFDDPGHVRFARKIVGVAKDFHKELQRTLKEEELAYQAHKKQSDADEKKRKDDAKKKLSSRTSIGFKNPIHEAKANSVIESRRMTTEWALSTLDEKVVDNSDTAKRLRGFSVEINGVKGVVLNFWKQMKRGPYKGARRTETGIPTLLLLTPKGEVKVENKGTIKILPDPVRSEVVGTKITGGMKKVGIKELVFDADIGSFQKKQWEESLNSAFDEFSKKMGISLNDKVKIHVYGQKGPKRGALADYSSQNKSIRMSAKKDKSFESLAHEIGHAVDDKLTGWRGVGSYHTRKLMSLWRTTPQGKREKQRIELERMVRGRASNWSSWANRPEEVFARCFEEYVAEKCPGWVKSGWTKSGTIDAESYEMVKPFFDKLMKDKDIKKAIRYVIRGVM